MNLFMNKETRLNIRVKPNFKDDLQAIAEYHGLTVSSYVHSVLVKAIREEKEREPEAFKTQPKIKTNGVLTAEINIGKNSEEKAS